MAESNLKKYVVCSDAIVVTIGKKANGRAEYTRVLRGKVINGNPESEQIQTFLKAKAIKLVSSKDELEKAQADLADPARSRLRQTARVSAASMGAPGDPVELPAQHNLPIAPTGGVVDPGNLTTADAE